MKQLNATDAGYFFMEQAAAGFHFTSLYLYDPATRPEKELSIGSVMAHINQRLQINPIFRRKVVQVPFNVDYPYWVDDEHFNLEFHLRHLALPKPGDWNQLCAMTSRLHSRPMDMSKPLWEMYLVEGLNIAGLPRDAVAILCKMHLATIDQAGNELAAILHDLTPAVSESGEQIDWRGETPPTPITLLRRSLFNNLSLPLRIARGVIGFGCSTLLNTKERIEEMASHDRKAGIPHTRFNTTVSQFRVYDGIQFPLEKLSEMRRTASGASVHDLVTAIISGGIREYLKQHGELPINSLSAGSYFQLASTRGRSMLEMITLPLHTDLPDPVERLSAIVASTSQELDDRQTLNIQQILAITPDLPAATFALAAKLMISTQSALGSYAKPKVNCIITNVPSPDKTLYFNGAKMIYQSALSPLMDGLGLNFMINSYDNTINLSFTSCREIVPDPDLLSQCIQSAYVELKAALLGDSNVVPINRTG